MTTFKSVNLQLELDEQEWQTLLLRAQDQGLTPQEVLQAAIGFYIEHGDEYRVFTNQCGEASEHYQRTGLHVTNDEIGAWIAELEAGNDDAEPPECHA